MSPRDPRAMLERARLYLCTGIRDGGAELASFLDAVLANGVDVVQLREKHADALAQLRAADVFRRICDEHGALFVVNDRADLAVASRADGVHVGQDDLPPDAARAIVGAATIVGRSTHASDEIERAHEERVDYLGVGPVDATPTKPGRPGVGLGLVEYAARTATIPWFVTGGMDARTIPLAAAAGARRFVVVRALTEAGDPGDAARRIRAAIDASA